MTTTLRLAKLKIAQNNEEKTLYPTASDREFQLVIFEPWALGDAIIAASAARQLKQKTLVVIQSKYLGIITDLLAEAKNVSVMGINLKYTERAKGKRFIVDALRQNSAGISTKYVYSIRGDFRDHLIASRLFPKSKILTNGWIGFFARRIKFFDRLLTIFKIQVKNRYELWDRLLNLDSQKIKNLPAIASQEKKTERKIIIHIGAQWRSKAYPDVYTLARNLTQLDYNCIIGYGPGDPPPRWEGKIMFLEDKNCITEFLNCQLIITNDSSAMHLAAFLGRPTLVIASISNIQEWIPPGVIAVCSTDMPTSYTPKNNYMSDSNDALWPHPDLVLDKIKQVIADKK
jgi:ADP-heptose:LPS heptosyltransferase